MLYNFLYYNFVSIFVSSFHNNNAMDLFDYFLEIFTIRIIFKYSRLEKVRISLWNRQLIISYYIFFSISYNLSISHNSFLCYPFWIFIMFHLFDQWSLIFNFARDTWRWYAKYIYEWSNVLISRLNDDREIIAFLSVRCLPCVCVCVCVCRK